MQILLKMLKILPIALILVVSGCKLVEREDIKVVDRTIKAKTPQVKQVPNQQNQQKVITINPAQVETITVEIEDLPISGEIYSDSVGSDKNLADLELNSASSNFPNPNLQNYDSQNQAVLLGRVSPVKPSNNQLKDDQKLDGVVLALLREADSHQKTGNLNLAATTLERAQRISPREPAVLYHLADIRLLQNNPQIAEQIATRALVYASGKPSMQAKLWDLISKCRFKLGDHSGSVQAHEQAQFFTNF